MLRIQVNPDELRALSAQLQRVAGDLHGLEGRLGQALNGLDWEVCQKAGVEGQVAQAHSQAHALAARAEEMGRYLASKAQAFENADQQGVSGIGQVSIAYEEIQREWMQKVGMRYSLPIAEVKRVLRLGEYLLPLASAAVIAASIRLGSSYAGQIIVDLPDFIRDFGVSLRWIREQAGLSGYLNHIKYTNIPSHFLKIGLGPSALIIALKWFTDIWEYKGTRLVSAMAVDAALTLAPVGISFIASKGGAVLGAAIGQLLFPVPVVGAAVGGAAGAILGGVVGNIVTQWVIDKYGVRGKAIEWTDKELAQPAVEAMREGIQAVDRAMGSIMDSIISSYSFSTHLFSLAH